MEKTKAEKIPEWEVLEDNAGGLYLVIFHKTSGRPRKILENWEFGEVGHMADALYNLEDDPDAWTTWNGDLLRRLDDMGDVDRDGQPWTLDSLYADLYKNCQCVAYRVPGLLTWDVDAMGTAARRALGFTFGED